MSTTIKYSKLTKESLDSYSKIKEAYRSMSDASDSSNETEPFNDINPSVIKSLDTEIKRHAKYFNLPPFH